MLRQVAGDVVKLELDKNCPTNGNLKIYLRSVVRKDVTKRESEKKVNVPSVENILHEKRPNGTIDFTNSSLQQSQQRSIASPIFTNPNQLQSHLQESSVNSPLMKETRNKINSLLLNYPLGVNLSGFMNSYMCQFNQKLPYRQLGYTKASSFMKSLNDLVKLERIDDSNVAIIPISPVFSKDSCSERRDDSVVKPQVTNENELIQMTRNNVFTLLCEYADGVRLAKFVDSYYKRFKEPMPFLKLGFPKAMSLMNYMSDMVRIEKKADDPSYIMVYPKYVCQSIGCQQTFPDHITLLLHKIDKLHI
jgi:hypothetical protein